MIGAFWSPEDDAVLRQLWADGLSAAAIGRAMGRSKGSVIGRSHRLDLPSRESPIVRDPSRRKTRRQATPRATIPPLEPLPMIIDDKEQAQLPLPRVVAGHFGGCQWIEGDGRPWATCGRPVVRRLSADGVSVATAWCAHHRARVYRQHPQVADAAD